MAKTRLTELAVARLRPPPEGRVDVWDSMLPAFGVRLTAAGKRSWIVAVRKPGAKHPARIKIGEPASTPLADARVRAREILQNPAAAFEQRDQAKLVTVASVLAEYIARYQRPRNRGWLEVEQVLQRELASWAERPVREIRRRDILLVLDAVADRASPVRANRVLAYLRKFFAWTIERGILEASPTAGIRPPGREVSRDRVLGPDEIIAVWRASDGLGWPFGALVQLLVVTAQRRDEIARMAWPDLDLERRLWTLPRALTKADRAHEVPLSPLAMETIERLPRMGDGLAFPANRRGSANPVSGFSKAKRRLDELSGVENWRLHDLRRTAASGMARLGHPPHVLSAILNHSPGGTMGVTAIYNRFRYSDEKRSALDAWSREIERMLGRVEQNIVALRAL